MFWKDFSCFNKSEIMIRIHFLIWNRKAHMLLTVSTATLQSKQANTNKIWFSEKKKVIMILNISTDFKFNIYSRGTVISGCLFKWNIKKEYWISNRVKVKKKYINSTSWVYMYKSDFWKRALVYYLFLSIHLETS